MSRKPEDSLGQGSRPEKSNLKHSQQLQKRDMDVLRSGDEEQFYKRLQGMVGHHVENDKLHGPRRSKRTPSRSDGKDHLHDVPDVRVTSPHSLKDTPKADLLGGGPEGSGTFMGLLHPNFATSTFGTPTARRAYSTKNLESSGHDHFHRPFDIPHREYDHQVTVEMKTTFLKINDIDTLSQQFEAEVYIQAKWEEIALIGMNANELDSLHPEDLWAPYLTILNAAGEFDTERRSYVVRYEDGYEAPVVLYRWRFKGLFREPLELAHFPFDVQDLTVQVSTERSIDEIKMKHDQHQLSAVSTRAFQDSHEWSIYKHVECTHNTTGLEYASSTIHPILVFSCRVRRNVWYFIWNIVLIVFLVMLLSFMTISVEPTASDRLGNTMTLFLTMVAFKLVVKQSLPTISYLTYLDMYVVGSMIYLVIFALENSAMSTLGRWMDKELVEAYDELFCMVLVFMVVTFHLVFIIHIQFTALKRHRQMKLNDRQYELQAQDLLKKWGQKMKRVPKK